MAEAQKIDGVNLQTITINAASPDVIGAVMKKITDEVMKAIPEGSLEKVAKEVISSGKIVWVRQSSSWGTSHDEVGLMDETKKRLGAELAKEIDRQVAAYLETEEIRKLVADSIAEGVKFALAELPAAAGSHFLSRLVGATLGDMHQWQPSTDDRLDNLANAVGKTQRALIDKGVLQYGQVPVVPVTA